VNDHEQIIMALASLTRLLDTMLNTPPTRIVRDNQHQIVGLSNVR
jgi:hypothetical protein